MPLADPFVEGERLVQNGLARLPPWLSRFFGYRNSKLPPSPNYLVCIYGFIGAFGGLGILFAVFAHTTYFTARNVPPVIASFGASAILCYGAIDVPLAQPRNLIFGHFFSALIGIVVATIFGFDLTDSEPHQLQWLAASLSTAIALIVMHLTKTTHPPAGATALMPCVDPGIWALRWYFLPVVLLSSTLVLASALIVNNIQRQYPKFWLAPMPVVQPPQSMEHRHRTPFPLTAEEQAKQEEKEKQAKSQRPYNNLRDLEAAH